MADWQGPLSNGVPAPSGPCSWPFDEGCCSIWADATGEQREFAQGFASYILWALSGRRFGLCPKLIRPCRESGSRGWLADRSWIGVGPLGALGSFIPVLSGGVWTNEVCGRCRSDCSCTELCEILLPPGAAQVTSVWQDGVELGPHLWRLDGRRLVRLPGQTVVTATPAVNNGQVVFNQPPGTGLDAVATLNPPGVLLPTAGLVYVIDVLTPQLADPWNSPAQLREDLAFDVAVQGAGTFQVNEPPAGCGLRVHVVAGGGTASIDGGGLVTFDGGNQPNAFQTIRVGAVCPTGVQQISVTPLDVDLIVTGVQWSDLTGEQECWPDCQDYTAGPFEEGAFTVEALYGQPAPLSAGQATGYLACEILKACVGQKCRLPSRVVQVSRPGVDMTLLDPQSFFEKGRTGIYEIDLWLRAVNPYPLHQRSRVWSPDVRRGRVVGPE